MGLSKRDFLQEERHKKRDPHEHARDEKRFGDREGERGPGSRDERLKCGLRSRL